LISESSDVARERRERIARQSSFKSMSYLIGYFSDVLSTTFFVVPSGNGRTVDGIEINRRFGLRRLRPGTPVPILAYAPWTEGGPTGEVTRLDSIEGGTDSPEPADLLIPEFSTRPLPPIEAVHEPSRTTFVLPGDAHAQEVERLAWAFRHRNGGPMQLGSGIHPLGDYLLHMPCRRLVRDLFIDESLYPGAVPRVTFVLPDANAHRRPPNEVGVRRYGDIHVSVSVEPLPRSDPRVHAVWIRRSRRRHKKRARASRPCRDSFSRLAMRDDVPGPSGADVVVAVGAHGETNSLDHASFINRRLVRRNVALFEK
jgi:hypothetical protein